jgi:5-methylcytosine-specific restriction endonuclease McrA
MMVRLPVLVLNQNYQPLNICDVRRAVSLMGRGKAESLLGSGQVLRSSSARFELPSVIRLVYLVKRPLHRRRLSRREVFARDGFRCMYCGTRSRDLTLDHVKPRSQGGQHIWDNVVSACKHCNHRKAGRTPYQASMRLISEPREPRPNPYAFFHAERVQESWRTFLPWVDDGHHVVAVPSGAQDDRARNGNRAAQGSGD